MRSQRKQHSATRRKEIFVDHKPDNTNALQLQAEEVVRRAELYLELVKGNEPRARKNEPIVWLKSQLKADTRRCKLVVRSGEIVSGLRFERNFLQRLRKSFPHADDDAAVEVAIQLGHLWCFALRFLNDTTHVVKLSPRSFKKQVLDFLYTEYLHVLHHDYDEASTTLKKQIPALLRSAPRQAATRVKR